MKKSVSNVLKVLFVVFLYLVCVNMLLVSEEANVTPFAKHGKLSVDGIHLVDSSQKPYQLYGMSTHGIGWYPRYISEKSFLTLRDKWNTNCIRLAMYTAEGGYCNGGNKDALERYIKNGVDYATKLGMYVIIDWHILSDKNPLVYKEEALVFFNKMSALYANHDNVLYEICNEPNTNADWGDISQYAEEVIPVIRKNDKDCIIIVGTPTWSQDIENAADAPLSFDNIMYTVHFYAATHKEGLRYRVETALKKGVPVFITEFGMCSADGRGKNDFEQAEEWFGLIEKYNISYCCWNLSNARETCAVLNSKCRRFSDWKPEDLSEAGEWIVNRFSEEKNR